MPPEDKGLREREGTSPHHLRAAPENSRTARSDDRRNKNSQIIDVAIAHGEAPYPL